MSSVNTRASIWKTFNRFFDNFLTHIIFMSCLIGVIHLPHDFSAFDKTIFGRASAAFLCLSPLCHYHNNDPLVCLQNSVLLDGQDAFRYPRKQESKWCWFDNLSLGTWIDCFVGFFWQCCNLQKICMKTFCRILVNCLFSG